MISLSFIVPKENLILIDSGLPLREALEVLEKNNFLSLPVVAEEKFLGVVSREQILKKLLEDIDDGQQVFTIVRTDIPHISLGSQMEDAAKILADTNTPFVAVNNELDQFVGIITHKTIFKHYTQLFGINKGYKLILNTYDVPGRLAVLTEIISKVGGNIISLIVDNPQVSTNVIKIILRVESDHIDKLKTSIENAGFSIRN